MLTKILTPKGNLVRFWRLQCRKMSDYSPADYKPPHMNELPVPSGSWEEGFRKQQTKFNMQLALGVAFFLGTVGYVYQSGLIELNLRPPLPNEK